MLPRYRWPHLLLFIPLCSPWPNYSRAGFCGPVEYSRSDGVSLLRLGYKRHCGFSLGVSFALRSLYLEEAICRVMSRCGEGVRPPANSPLNEYGSGSSSPGKLLGDCGPESHIHISTTISWETLGQNQPGQLLPDLTFKNYMNRKVCCLKLLNLGVIFTQ